ncbi:MAG: DJ-1/PfpI family protein [Methylococcaceae bacterium]|nr:DJ-1/PfpI family protein [Methylococcaceae bacterium]
MSHNAHEAFMAVREQGFKMMGNEHMVMFLYPGMNPLDLVAPQYLFASMMGAKIYLISSNNDLQPVSSGGGLAILPTHTWGECYAKPDVLFLPGGAQGTLEVMKNTLFIDFIKNKAPVSKYITSVCTGSLILGKAGLLKGKRATSHWVTLDMLAKQGAIPVNERVVWDTLSGTNGKIVTGGGVTAGIDFGLEIVAALRGKTYAEAIQLEAEYNPKPPFNAGSPDTASPFVRDNLKNIYAPFLVDLVSVL